MRLVLIGIIATLLLVGSATAVLNDAGFWKSFTPASKTHKTETTVRTTITAPRATETVTCTFGTALARSECMSQYGKCSGYKSCTVKVTAENGKKVSWGSKCRSNLQQAISTMDGKDETVSFRCGEKDLFTERVTCVFGNTTAEQTCKNYKGSCTGTNNCTISVEGKFGQNLVWTACGRPIKSVINGRDETLTFNCKKK